MKPENSNLCDVADLNVTLERLDGDRDLLRELADLYIADYPGQLQNLFDAVEAGDIERIKRVAHKIKGTAWSFGAKPASALAARLEETKEIADGKNATALAKHLSNELTRLHLALEEFL